LSGFHTNFHSYARHYRLGWLQPLLFHYLCRFHNRTSATLVASVALRDYLQAAGVNNVCVLGRGVDTQLFTPERRCAALRRTWGVSESDLAVLYVGRIAPEKNLGLAVAAYHAMQRCKASVKLSLSRLHHWLPRGPPHPEGVQGPAEVPHQSAAPLLPPTHAGLHATTALDPAVDRRAPSAPLGEGLGGPWLLQGPRCTAGLLRRPEALHGGPRARQAAPRLPHPPPGGARGGGASAIRSACRRPPSVARRQRRRRRAGTRRPCCTVWSLCLPREHAACSAGAWRRTIRRAVPSWAQGGGWRGDEGRRRRPRAAPGRGGGR
jgi:hypothetical protein